jgi:hypothetical protein
MITRENDFLERIRCFRFAENLRTTTNTYYYSVNSQVVSTYIAICRDNMAGSG